MENKVILYQPDETIKVDVRLEGDTVWLSQEQIAQLFGVGQAAISKHIRNVYECGELQREGTYSILEYMGGNRVYETKIYNLDVILSVGYRVSSINATHFRQWARCISSAHQSRMPATRRLR